MPVPILPTEDRFSVHLKSKLWTGETGQGRYVPNLDDLVVDYNVGFERVVSVDVTTGLSTTIPWTLPKESGISMENVLLGIHDDFTQQCWRVWIDDSQQPIRLAVDSRLRVNATPAASHIKIFYGYDISQTGEVISAMINNTGQITSENIPLQAATLPDGNNISIKVPVEAWSTRPMDDGAVCTAVVYSTTGAVLSKSRLLVENSGFIRGSEAASRYITGISLQSPYLSDSDESLLQIPVNVPISSIPLIGVVSYNVGEPVRVAIDGVRMSLLGMDGYVATTAGQRNDLVLKYVLSPEETSYQLENSNQNYVARSYQAEVLPVQGAYNVKLFAVPQWQGALTGWKLDWYLYNLDRSVYEYCTPHVQLSATSAPFQPLLYGAEQQCTFVVNLADIAGHYGQFSHVQTLRITLVGDGIQDRTPWFLRYSGLDNTSYGAGLSARVERIAIGDSLVRLGSGAVTLADWLERTYYVLEPLRNPNVETRPPAPTHFTLELDGIYYEFEISQWNASLQITSPGVVGRSAVIHWERRIGTTTLQLAAAPMAIVHVN